MFLTPNEPPSDNVVRWLRIPADSYWIGLVGGALQALTNPYLFEEYGDYSADDTTQVFRRMLLDWNTPMPSYELGSIVSLTTATVPSNMLECDGGVYLKEDYPDYVAVMHSAFSVDATHFKVPDLRGRGVVGLGQFPNSLHDWQMNDEYGEELHYLTEGELAQHQHGQRILNNASAYRYTGVAGSFTTYTGGGNNSNTRMLTDGAGGNEGHENIPPITALLVCVVVKKA